MMSAQEALGRLREGNRRFAAGRRLGDTLSSPSRRAEVAKGQEPIAVILGCSDSRVPADIVFDQGLGDLFVVRVAGNIAALSQIGSVEFAVSKLGVRLVVVLGHSHCGAVTAALEELEQPTERRSEGLDSILDRIRPSVEQALVNGPPAAGAALVGHAVRANISAQVRRLQHGSETVKRLIREEGLRVVGAEYSLETGLVEFFEGELG
ncbi:MAG: carbonic anhydrase [bacterium]|nr:carbonic anhydrase [bacterium]